MIASEQPRTESGQQGRELRLLGNDENSPLISDWLYFAEDGSVVLYCGKVEVGQGIRTSLAQAIAEELRLPLERISIVFADTVRTPYDMGTVGSRTTTLMTPRLHKVAASARELLMVRAAERWQVSPIEVQAENGTLCHPTKGTLAYAELTDDGWLDEAWSEEAPVTPPDEWRVAGQADPYADRRDFVTGRHRFTSDLPRPDILLGAVLRRGSFNSTLSSLDTSAAEAVAGVEIVSDGEFVGLTAPDTISARQAIKSVEASWQPGEQVAQEDLFDYLKAHPAEPQPNARWGGPQVIEEGSLEEGRANGQTLAATYTVPYIAHVPLEPRAAVAEWQGERLTVWTGTQRPFGVRTELATAFDIAEEQVRVIVPDTGGAYGGKHTGDAAVEAARLARKVGRPVKLVWTREEEFTWAYFRPAGVIDVSGTLDASGRITAWEHTNYNSGAQAMRPPYAIPNMLVTFQPAVSPLRQGSYRALAATANTFARESHIDELAHLTGIDPLEFRLRNLEDERLRAVLSAAAERFGWPGKATPGRGCGIACGTEKASYVATCAEVEVAEDGRPRVVRIVEAYECGAIVNPDGLTAQVEGAVIQAIGGALYERIDFGAGKIHNPRLSQYQVPRFADVPEIEVVLLNRKDLPPIGGSETPIIGPAPAIANAIFAATGRRLRHLPLAPGGFLRTDA